MKNILLLIALAGTLTLNAQQRIYVRSDATGANSGQSWADAYHDLQAAIQASQPGDTLWVAKGTYRPAATTDRTLSFEPKSGTLLYGGFVGTETQVWQRDWVKHPTVLSGDIGTPGDSLDNSRCVVYLFEPDSSTVLDGLVVRDGVADATGGTSTYARGRSGAGLYVMGQEAEAYPVIRNCRFEHNTARNFGGGALVNGTSDGSVGPLFWRCTFVNNRASNGGGMARHGAAWIERGTDWDSCVFIGNYAALRGGGLYYYDTDGQDSTQIHGCTFVENFAGTAGGGGFFYLGRNMGQTRFSVHNCLAAKNKSLEGIAFNFFTNFGLFEGSVEVSGSGFEENQALTTGTSSVLFMDLIANSPSTTVLISSNLFQKNTAQSRVTALYCFDAILLSVKNIFRENKGQCSADGDFNEAIISGNIYSNNYALSKLNTGGAMASSTSTYHNCAFIGNRFEPKGLVFEITIWSFLKIVNCNFIDNDGNLFFRTSSSTDSAFLFFLNSVMMPPVAFYGSSFSKSKTYLSFSAFDSLDCPSQGPAVTCGPNNLIGLDPIFLSPDSNDYRLQPCSPLVNAGSNAHVSASNTTDLGGQPRIQGDKVDIGAYETAAPALSAVPVVLPACKGQPNGSVSLPVAGGCAPLTYQWASAGGKTGSGTGGLSAGVYTFTVSDQRGSTFTLSVALPDSGSIALSATGLPVQCGDTLGGTAIAHAQGGTPPLGFGWLGSTSADSLRSGLAPGTYTVTVTDERGCTATATAEVKKQGNLASEAEVEAISCYGAADGSLTVLPTNGKPPYDWHWQGSPTNGPTLSPLGPGQYRLTLTDAFGCDILWVLPLTQPDSLFVENVVLSPASDSMASDGSITVSATGGTLPYAAKWSNMKTGLSLNGLAPGAYTLTLTDANDCSFTATYVAGVTSGTNEPQPVLAFAVQPNPTEGLLDVLFSKPTVSSSRLDLYDTAGRKWQEWQLPIGAQRIRLDMSDLPSGVYWLQVRSVQGAGVKRVVKQ